jgi:hypothetical protein
MLQYSAIALVEEIEASLPHFSRYNIFLGGLFQHTLGNLFSLRGNLSLSHFCFELLRNTQGLVSPSGSFFFLCSFERAADAHPRSFGSFVGSRFLLSKEVRNVK